MDQETYYNAKDSLIDVLRYSELRACRPLSRYIENDRCCRIVDKELYLSWRALFEIAC